MDRIDFQPSRSGLLLEVSPLPLIAFDQFPTLSEGKAILLWNIDSGETRVFEDNTPKFSFHPSSASVRMEDIWQPQVPAGNQSLQSGTSALRVSRKNSGKTLLKPPRNMNLG